MKKKIINWIREILGINQIQKDLSKNIVDIERNVFITSGLAEELKSLVDVLDIGVDIQPRSESWAIVCIKGKADYIKLFTFQEKDERDVKSFLRNFRDKNIIIDKPYGLPKEYYFR